MRNFIKTLCFLIVCFACNIREEHKIIKPLEQCVRVDVLDDNISYAKAIPLVMPDSMLVNLVSKILILKNGDFIILQDSGVLQFNENGEFVQKIGEIGRANNEYLRPKDIALSNNEKSIFILDSNDRILEYSMDNGSFVNQKIIGNGTNNYEALAVTKNGDFLMYHSNPADFYNFDTPYYALTQYNNENEIVSELLPRKDFVFSMGQITRSYKGNYIIRPQEGDNIYYETTDEGITPISRIDFGDRQAPAKSIFVGKGLDMYNYIRSDYYKLPLYFQDTKDALYFSSIGEGGLECDFVYFKNLQKGIYWSPKEASDPIIIRASDEDYFYAIYTSSFLTESSAEQFKNMSPLKRYFIENLEVKGENTYIIKLKFK